MLLKLCSSSFGVLFSSMAAAAFRQSFKTLLSSGVISFLYLASFSFSHMPPISSNTHCVSEMLPLPFVVACEVTQLPGTFGWYSDNLNSHFSDWSNLISAIMLFRRSVHGLDILKWEFIFFKNPNATNPFPECVQIPNEGFVAQHFYE